MQGEMEGHIYGERETSYEIVKRNNVQLRLELLTVSSLSTIADRRRERDLWCNTRYTFVADNHALSLERLLLVSF
jgi:hypothetical protein